MIKKAFFSSLLFFSIISAFFLTHFFILKDSDYKEYQSIIDQKDKTKEKNLAKRVHQVRTGVQKDIFLKDENPRLHFRIQSSTSKITLVKENNKTLMVEKLSDLKCYFQDKVNLDEKMQQFR